MLLARVVRSSEVVRCDGPTIFKIGFTHDAYHRMLSQTGYVAEGYCRMHLLYIAASSAICKCLEAHLIRLYKGQPGCYNINLGGEGPDHYDGPYFCYLALKRA
jgi:hypothetical protein